ncbi:DUF421 domain-containing protein [Fredinandcohnia sp. QZ13]|uniref:DUF421 domain-containing protein n=1 Tax=Fredinandcohnia sp. QZ13 TaxID=3073144 RepID=UPI0028537208|nr:YetF domain-containing protein [Fredinandcohnia sp. QZ13]MDR4889665.1 DUF421 domain-containing protein [Fredinandcohnia sp. QZ13]
MNYIWEALAILFTGFCLFRIAGKKTVAEMTALETITILAMASTIGHAISENDLVKTIFALCALVTLLMFSQFLAIKFNIIEKLFIGKPTTVIQDGIIITNNLKKLRMTSEQLEAMVRQKGISSVTDIKTASVEITGQLGYELIKSAKPVTIGELEQMLNQLQSNILQQLTGTDQPSQNDKKIND